MDARDPIREEEYYSSTGREFVPQPPVVIGDGEDAEAEEPVANARADTSMIAAHDEETAADEPAPTEPPTPAVVKGSGALATDETVELTEPDGAQPADDPPDAPGDTETSMPDPAAAEFLNDDEKLMRIVEEMSRKPIPSLPDGEVDDELDDTSMDGPSFDETLDQFSERLKGAVLAERERLAEVEVLANADPEPPQENVSFHFVECDHAPTNAEPIANALDDCDTVVFEAFGGEAVDREMIEAAVNLLLKGDLSSAETAMCQFYLGLHSMDYIAETIPHLPDSVQRAYLFDVSEDHAAASLVAQASQANESVGQAIENHEPNAEISARLQTFLTTMAEASALREPAMVEQLNRIARLEAVGGACRVGVVVGRTHTGIRTGMVDQGFGSSRTSGLADEHPYVRAPEHATRLLTRLIHDPTAEVTPTELNRATIEQIARGVDYNAYAAESIATAIPDTKLPALMAELDGIKQVDKPAEERRTDLYDAMERALEAALPPSSPHSLILHEIRETDYFHQNNPANRLPPRRWRQQDEP